MSALVGRAWPPRLPPRPRPPPSAAPVSAGRLLSNFDPDSYLDKIFHLRVDLPPLADDSVRSLVAGLLDAKWPGAGTTRDLLLKKMDEHTVTTLPPAMANSVKTIAAKSPRVVKRIIEKLCLLTTSVRDGEDDAWFRESLSVERFPLLLAWLAMAERFPSVRQALQEGGPQFYERFTKLCTGYNDPESRNHNTMRYAALLALPQRRIVQNWAKCLML